MIINLNGTVKNDEIKFDLCPVFFNQNQNVQVNELFIKWAKPVKNIYGYIESSLIDQSPVNLSDPPQNLSENTMPTDITDF